MKVEVRCPGCDRGTLVDEVSLGGELLCPGCLTRITLRRPEPASAPVLDAPRLRAVEAATPIAVALPARARAAAARPAAAVAAAAEPKAEQVVCPRCKLHFNPDPHTNTSAARDKPTVLVVEDTAIFQEIARDALSDRFRVETVETVQQARTRLIGGGIDLLVLDLTLEGGDHGRRFLADFPGKPCPIVIFTARDESEMYGDFWEELKRLGADELVLKGMNVGESLRRKVSVLLGVDVDEEERGKGARRP